MQALEQHSERSAEPKRLGAAHGAPYPISVPIALAHRASRLVLLFHKMAQVWNSIILFPSYSFPFA
jgi:hypothetical protein